MKRRKRPTRDDVIQWLAASGRWSYRGPGGESPIPPPEPKPNWQAAFLLLLVGLGLGAMALTIGAEQLRQGNTIILVPVALFSICAILFIAAALRAFRNYLHYRSKTD